MEKRSQNLRSALHVTRYKLRASPGFSLIEILITIALFLILAGGIYFSYANILEVIGRTRMRTIANSLLNKEIEYIRNLKYDDVGIAGGYPVGVIPATKTVTYENQQFTISAFVRNIDDAFDGQTGSSPNDTAPADYRLVELQAKCPTCFNFNTVIVTTWAAPQNLESSTQNGSLLMRVFDANGQMISNADVTVKNTALSPNINITDATGNDGYLRLIDIPTSTTAYQITVSKTGYSTSTTYLPGATANPNPLQPHITIASQQVSGASFSIDRVSQIDVKAQNQYCVGIASKGFTQKGAKLIGSLPNVLKYDNYFAVGNDGTASRKNLEWDTYSFSASDTAHYLAGSMPMMPITLSPNTTTSINFLLEPKATSTLLVTAVDNSNNAISGVSFALSKTGFSSSKLSGEKVFSVSDWSGTAYDSQDGTIESEETPGQLRLETPGTTYATSTNSYLISNTLDMGTSTVTYRNLDWSPTAQDSGTSLSFQIASSDDEAGPFNFVGPDGGSSSYYSATGTIYSGISDKRYLRYKVFMNTTNSDNTPKLDDLSISFTSGCVPSGQATWQDLSSATYLLTAVKTGYQTATSSITVGSGWQEARVVMQ